MGSEESRWKIADATELRQAGVPGPWSDAPMRRRTRDESLAYIQGFDAGVRAALDEVRRLNFPDVADRAEPGISVRLGSITGSLGWTEGS